MHQACLKLSKFYNIETSNQKQFPNIYGELVKREMIVIRIFRLVTLLWQCFAGSFAICVMCPIGPVSSLRLSQHDDWSGTKTIHNIHPPPYIYSTYNTILIRRHLVPFECVPCWEKLFPCPTLRISLPFSYYSFIYTYRYTKVSRFIFIYEMLIIIV